MSNELSDLLATFTARIQGLEDRISELESQEITPGTVGGLIVGSELAPTDEEIRLYRSGTLMGQLSTDDTTWLRLNQDVAKNIYTPRLIRADGGLAAGNTTPGSGNVGYTGDLTPVRGGTAYTAYGFVPVGKISVYIGATISASQTITVSGVPTDAVAILCRFEHTTATVGRRLALGASSSDSALFAITQVAGVPASAYGAVASTGNQLYLYTNGTANSVNLLVYGYFI